MFKNVGSLQEIEFLYVKNTKNLFLRNSLENVTFSYSIIILTGFNSSQIISLLEILCNIKTCSIKNFIISPEKNHWYFLSFSGIQINNSGLPLPLPKDNISQKEVAASYFERLFKEGVYGGNVKMLETAYLFKINIAVYQLNICNSSHYTTIKVNDDY